MESQNIIKIKEEYKKYIRKLIENCLLDESTYVINIPIDMDGLLEFDNSFAIIRKIHYSDESPFRELQYEFFKKGYYLLDLTNSNKINIQLFVEKPNFYDNQKLLSHKFNKLLFDI